MIPVHVSRGSGKSCPLHLLFTLRGKIFLKYLAYTNHGLVHFLVLQQNTIILVVSFLITEAQHQNRTLLKGKGLNFFMVSVHGELAQGTSIMVEGEDRAKRLSL